MQPYNLKMVPLNVEVVPVDPNELYFSDSDSDSDTSISDRPVELIDGLFDSVPCHEETDTLLEEFQSFGNCFDLTSYICSAPQDRSKSPTLCLPDIQFRNPGGRKDLKLVMKYYKNEECECEVNEPVKEKKKIEDVERTMTASDKENCPPTEVPTGRRKITIEEYRNRKRSQQSSNNCVG